MNPTGENNSLQIENLTILRDKTPLLSLNETIKGGEVLTIMGPSGSGKSTLLNWLTGMLPKGFNADGNVHLNGVNITHTAKLSTPYGFIVSRRIVVSAFICC